MQDTFKVPLLEGDLGGSEMSQRSPVEHRVYYQLPKITVAPIRSAFPFDHNWFFPDGKDNTTIGAVNRMGRAGRVDHQGAAVVFALVVDLGTGEDEDVFKSGVVVFGDAGSGLVAQ